MIAPLRKPLFELGAIVATPAARKAIDESDEELREFLARHECGDWGSLLNEERDRNNAAVKTGERIISEYRTGNGVKIRIITAAADATGRRPTTNILLSIEFKK